MNDQRLKAPPSRSALGALRRIVGDCGIHWTLTALAEVIRREPRFTLGRRTDLAEQIARDIEKARDS